jgi:hypothetical protein
MKKRNKKKAGQSEQEGHEMASDGTIPASAVVSYYIEHSIRNDGVEVVTVNEKDTYIVDREREELRNVCDPSDRLCLDEQQFGRDPQGDVEILERYVKKGDRHRAVVLDSSPNWLASLRRG